MRLTHLVKYFLAAISLILPVVSYGQCVYNPQFDFNGGIGGAGRIGQTFEPCEIGFLESVSFTFNRTPGEYRLYVSEHVGGLIQGGPIAVFEISIEDIFERIDITLDQPYEITNLDLHEFQVEPSDDQFFFMRSNRQTYDEGFNTFNGRPFPSDIDLVFDLRITPVEVVPTLNEWACLNLALILCIICVVSINSSLNKPGLKGIN